MLTQLVEKENATPEVQAAYAELEKMLGMVGPPFKVIANKPEYLKVIVEKFKVAMGPGKIDEKTKLLVYLATSIMNNNDMCVYVFTNMLKQKMKMSDEELVELYSVIDIANTINHINTAAMIKPPNAENQQQGNTIH
jgi:alkylhydroperoxidase/carboxymuconolactone decarboxylase family protein YurZ